MWAREGSAWVTVGRVPGWPATLFALSGLMLLAGTALGLAVGDGGSEAADTAATAMVIGSLAVFPLAVLVTLARILQRPGAGRHRDLIGFCCAAWLVALGLVWAGLGDAGDGDYAIAAIALGTVALLPFALWPVALWLTAERRGRRPPVRPALALLGLAAVLAAAAWLLGD
ncbi:MAG: hypothetical protein K0S15_26 [Solirubrobacterales bacterium]|nr:hypothetical protein [Solirubrobacterales bacterium]